MDEVMDGVSWNCVRGLDSSLTMPFSSIASSIFNIPFSNTHLKKFRVNIRVSLINSHATHKNQHLGFKNDNRNRHLTQSRASDSFTQLKEAIKTLQNDLSPQTLSRVLSAQEDLALTLQIFDWASRQKNYKHDNKVSRVLFRKLCSSKEFDEVERVLDEMHRNGWEISEDILIWTITSCCESERLDKAENILKKLEYGCRPSVSLYNGLLKTRKISHG